MKSKLIFLIAMFMSGIAYADASFVGKYKCHGHDPYLNKDYAGTIEIAQHNAVYSLIMKYDTGEDMIATGGQYNNQLLFVVFQDIHKPKHIGLEQYEWKENNTKLAGYWVYLSQDKLGREICEKVPVTS
jgi:hypothetical protein